MELERQSRGRDEVEYRSNGRASPAWSDSPQGSQPLTPRSSLGGAELLTDSIPSDPEGLVEEVKRLRTQLQGATENWAREKQMSAQVTLVSVVLWHACTVTTEEKVIILHTVHKSSH